MSALPRGDAPTTEVVRSDSLPHLKPHTSVRGILRSSAAVILPPLIAFVALIAFWEFYIAWKDVSVIVMPAPSTVAERFVDDRELLWREGFWTLYEASLGLLFGSAAAIFLAAVMAHSRLVERTVFPLAILIKVTPIVAIAPVLVIILGFGTTPKIVVAALLSFFPMLVNAMTGFRDVNPGALEFMQSLRASTWQTFWKLRVPGSLPYIFAALRITFPLAIIGAVVAEWFTGTRGLGYVIYVANANLNTPTLFAAIAVLAICGVAINAALSIIERRVLFWHESVRTTR
jgi:NitT/TauT family transport system permease protein